MRQLETRVRLGLSQNGGFPKWVDSFAYSFRKGTLKRDAHLGGDVCLFPLENNQQQVPPPRKKKKQPDATPPRPFGACRTRRSKKIRNVSDSGANRSPEAMKLADRWGTRLKQDRLAPPLKQLGSREPRSASSRTRRRRIFRGVAPQK